MRVYEGLIFKWQKAHYDEVVRSGKRKDTDADSDKSKKQRAGTSSSVVKAGEYCEGCGKQRHKRESCQLTSHANYNEKGLWIHSEGYRIKKAWNEANGKGDEHPELRWYEYAGGGIIRGAHNPGEKARPERSGRQQDRDPPRWQPAKQSVSDAHGHKPATRRIEFEGVKDRDTRGGTPRVLATISTVRCDCDDADVDITYRMCCITVDTSPSFKAATLFDTGANASYVNREVAAWIEDPAGKGKRKGGRKRGWEAERSTSVSLAGTSMSSPILGNVVFDLTFLNEVSKKHETIKDIHAQVLDSCIANYTRVSSRSQNSSVLR